MVPDPGQAGAGQHSAHRPFHRAEDETGEHRGEHLISRCGETGPETVQQRRQGIGYTDRGGHWWNTPFIGGVADTTNVPPHSIKSSAGAPREWCSIQGAKSPFSFSDTVIRYFGPWKVRKSRCQCRARNSRNTSPTPSTDMPTPVGPNSKRSPPPGAVPTDTSPPGSPPPNPSGSAASNTSATPTTGASPSTTPAPRPTSTADYPTVPSPAPRNKPSTPPSASTSKTPQPGKSTPRRINAVLH